MTTFTNKFLNICSLRRFANCAAIFVIAFNYAITPKMSAFICFFHNLLLVVEISLFKQRINLIPLLFISNKSPPVLEVFARANH
jgi:hypothetical protein